MIHSKPFNTVPIKVAFTLIYPGFYVYHFLVTQSFLPPFLEGYSTAIATLALPLVTLSFVRQRLGSPIQPSSIELTFFAFLFYYLILLSMHLALGDKPTAIPPHFGIILQFLCLYLLAAITPANERSFQRIALASFLLMTASIVFYASEGAFIIAALDIPDQDGKAANYQNYAFIYSVVMFYLIAYASSARKRLLIYLIGLPALFINGARTEFIWMAIILFGFEFSLSHQKGLVLTALSTILLLSVLSTDTISDLLPDNRILSLLTDLSEDQSAIERRVFFSHGLRTISDHPLLGDFASYEAGEFIHNILSAWVDLGVLGFICMVGLLAVPAIDLLVSPLRLVDSGDLRLSVLLLVFAMALSITAKHFTHQLFPVAVGAYAQLICRLNYSRHCRMRARSIACNR